jgi:hypothetical protein
MMMGQRLESPTIELRALPRNSRPVEDESARDLRLRAQPGAVAT